MVINYLLGVAHRLFIFSREKYWLPILEGDFLYLPLFVVDALRQVFWREAFFTWLDNPLTGIGINTTDLHQQLQGSVRAYFSQDIAQNAMTYVHNRFVEMLLETGLLGFVPFVIFLGVLCFSHFKQFVKNNDIFALLFLLSQVIYWSLGLFQFSMWEIWIFPIFAINLIFIKALSEEVK